MLGSDELAVRWIAKRRNLHEACDAAVDTGLRECHRTAHVNRLESLFPGFPQDARRIDHRIHAAHGIPPLLRFYHLREIAVTSFPGDGCWFPHAGYHAISALPQASDEITPQESACPDDQHRFPCRPCSHACYPLGWPGQSRPGEISAR